MLEIGVVGLDPEAFEFDDLAPSCKQPLAAAHLRRRPRLAEGMAVEEVHRLSGIDPWFLHQIAEIVDCRARLAAPGTNLDEALLREAKGLGFSDKAVAELSGDDRGHRPHAARAHGIVARLCQIDTLAAEYPAETNYLYFSYHAQADDVAASWRKKVLVLGGGAYRIGLERRVRLVLRQHGAAAQELGLRDPPAQLQPRDRQHRLRRVRQAHLRRDQPRDGARPLGARAPVGVVVSMGGQVPNNLALKLHRAGVKVLGTSPDSIDRAEDREKFSDLLDTLHIDQPRWRTTVDTSPEHLALVAEGLGGYPLLVRPSYVLSGAAMTVAHEPPAPRQLPRRGDAGVARSPGGDHQV
jgi:carbamoyl-phosphate synthase large subunit